MQLTQKSKDDATIEENIQRAKVLKELGPLADAYSGYAVTRKVSFIAWHLFPLA